MTCSTCTRTKPIPNCLDNLVLGDTDVNTTSVYVYLKNLATGYIQRTTVTTSAAGLVTVDMANFEISENFTYNIWVTLATATNNEDYKPLTIGDEAYDCLQLRFEKAWNLVDGESEVVETTVEQILEVE